MGRHHELSPRAGHPAFLGQLRQQPRVQEVLRLFDAGERWRLGVVQQHEIRQHLQRPVGGELREHRLVERCILDLQQQAAVGHRIGQHALDARHAAAQNPEDALELVAMLLRKILDHVRQVVAGFRHPLLRACLRLPTRTVGGEIGHVPATDEFTQRRDAWMLGKLPQRIDGQQVRRLERNLDSPTLLVGESPLTARP